MSRSHGCSNGLQDTCCYVAGVISNHLAGHGGQADALDISCTAIVFTQLALIAKLLLAFQSGCFDVKTRFRR